MKSAADNVEHKLLLAGKRIVQRFGLLGTTQEKITVFVAGVQRSGTNLIMDILERSYETDVYHERDSRAFDNYQMRELEVIDGLYTNCRASHFVIKSLCELHRLNNLMVKFEPARTVWMVRRYQDVVNSMLSSFRNQAQQIKRIAALRDLDSWWFAQGMSDATYTIVKRVVRGDIDDASAAALQWYIRNILYFEQDLDRDQRVILVPYERLVSDPQHEIFRIFKFLKLKYTPRVSAKVFTSSVRKKQSPPIIGAIRDVCEHLTSRFVNRTCG